MISLEKMLQDRKARPEEALQLFDALEPTTLELMKGRWKGYEIKTGHPIDGLLALSGWYGKLFKNPEEVHPLLFYANRKTKLFSVNPKLIPLQLNFPKSTILGTFMQLLRPILQTQQPRARMRMIEYRGKVTGTMVYDEKAIMDHFVKIDENTLLGIMDLKRTPRPYVFVLERDAQEYQLLLKNP
jgi:hypothetical protein